MNFTKTLLGPVLVAIVYNKIATYVENEKNVKYVSIPQWTKEELRIVFLCEMRRLVKSCSRSKRLRSVNYYSFTRRKPPSVMA